MSTNAGVRPLPQPAQPGESYILLDTALPAADTDEAMVWNVVTRGRAGTSAKTSVKRIQNAGRQPKQASINSFEAATAAANRRKAEGSTSQQNVLLNELLLRLIKTQDE